MRGCLLISHGPMCHGMLESLKMFFGDDIEQIDTLALDHDMGADGFMRELVLKASGVDSGEGVVIFCDMLGGTPANQALRLCSDTVQVIVGMNLPMVMEFLAARVSDVDITDLLENAKKAIADGNAMMAQDSDNYDDD